MLRSLALALALAGCSAREGEVASAAPAPSAAVAPDPIAKGVPHGGQIVEIAATEPGDAALTLDAVGSVRLWPALDASRPPVVVSLVAPKQLALAHAGRDLLAAALDEAGAIDLVRLGRDGSVRGRVQLPGVGYQQVLAFDGGVLVRSDDHVIEWLDADGESRGKLVAEPSHRIQALALRRGRGAAVIAAGDKHELRWLHTIGGTLTWGPSIALPVAVQGELIALSPSHRRFALVDPTGTASVYEIGVKAVRVGNTVLAHGARDVGFIDEDRVAIMGRTLSWWVMPQQPDASDPWAVPAAGMPIMASSHLGDGGAVADGLAVTGHGGALALTDKQRTRYLGYKQHSAGHVGVAPSSLWLSVSGSHIVWLDDKLAVAREIELREDPNAPWLYATPIGDRHVVTQAPADGKYAVQLVDLDQPDAPILLGSYPSVERVDYEPASGLLAISLYGTVRRFAVDLATNAVRELPALQRTGSVSQLRLLDPARADGMTAVSVGWDGEHDEYLTVTIHRARGKRQKIKKFDATLIDVEPDGTFYAHRANEIQVRRGDRKLATIPAKGVAAPIAVARGGERFAVRDGSDIVVIDRLGVEQWRKTVWGISQLLFTKDGKHLVVRAAGGLAMLAAETGEREALECGWSFALMATAPPSSPQAFAPVCEDPML
jgi:hypothetical protein